MMESSEVENSWSCRKIKDKKRLQQFLCKDPYLYLYLLGDLDDFYWPLTTFWACEQADGELLSVFMFYDAPTLPVLLAFENSNRAAARFLLKQIIPQFPAKCFAHLSLGLRDLLESTCSLKGVETFVRMRLERPKELKAYLSCSFPIRRLSVEDLPVIRAFYKQAYPNTWFDQRMLETGRYFGAWDGSKLLSLSGIHVYAKDYGVASLGNIATLPTYRRQGLGLAVIARLCLDLLEDIEYIGLNVHSQNQAALNCYCKLGFKIHVEYEELMVEKHEF